MAAEPITRVETWRAVHSDIRRFAEGPSPLELLRRERRVRMARQIRAAGSRGRCRTFRSVRTLRILRFSITLSGGVSRNYGHDEFHAATSYGKSGGRTYETDENAEPEDAQPDLAARHNP